MLVNAIGYLCEAAWHHADLSVTWGKLWVKLKTHSEGGITDKDFALAQQNRGNRAVAPRAGRAAGGDTEQICAGQKVSSAGAIGHVSAPESSHTPADTTVLARAGAAGAAANRRRKRRCRRRVHSTSGRQTGPVSRCWIKRCQSRFDRL